MEGKRRGMRGGGGALGLNRRLANHGGETGVQRQNLREMDFCTRNYNVASLLA